MNRVVAEAVELPQGSYFYLVMLTPMAIRWQYELVVLQSKAKLKFAGLEADRRI